MQGFAAVIAVILALAATVTKGTDFVRNFDKGDTWPKWLWNVVPMVIGVGLCWGWQQSFVGDLIAQVPALVGKTMNTQLGYVLSGLIVGGAAGGFHELFDALSGIASQTHAVAALPSAEPVMPVDVMATDVPSEDG